VSVWKAVSISSGQIQEINKKNCGGINVIVYKKKKRGLQSMSVVGKCEGKRVNTKPGS
jgi:hypothetical protein